MNRGVDNEFLYVALIHTFGDIQGSANPRTPGLVNFVTAVAYHFCLNLPEKFSQPGARGLANPCTKAANLSKWDGDVWGACSQRINH